MNRILARLIPAIAALVLSPVVWTHAAEELVTANEVAIELPNYEIRADRVMPPPEVWRYASVPGFEILSDGSDGQTQFMVKELRGFSRAVGVLWPALGQATSAEPAKLILCSKSKSYAPFINTAQSSAAENRQLGLHLRDFEKGAIVLDLAADTVLLSAEDAAAGIAASGGGGLSAVTESPGYTASSGFEADASGSAADAAGAVGGNQMLVDQTKLLRREYMHYAFARFEQRLPAWVEEGLAQIFMAMTFDEKLIRFARMGDPLSMQTTMSGGFQNDTDFTKALDGARLIPFDQLFALSREDEAARRSFGSQWAKQSQGFVHMCLFGQKKKYREPLLKFIDRLRDEPASEKMFTECFGMNYKKMLVILRTYADYADHDPQEIKAGPTLDLSPFPSVAIREATEGEKGRIKGEVLRMAGNPEAAFDSLSDAYIRGDRDPVLVGALGIEEARRGRTERALKLLDFAVKGGVRRPLVYVELSNMRLAEVKLAPAEREKGISARQLAFVLKPLFQAMPIEPRPAELYASVAAAWRSSAAVPKAENLAVLNEGIMAYPKHTQLILDAAELSARAGLKEQAIAIATHGLRVIVDAPARQQLESLQKNLAAPQA